MVEKLLPYAKSIFAALGAVAVVIQAALTDGTITTEEWGQIVVAVLVAAGVYQIRNKSLP